MKRQRKTLMGKQRERRQKNYLARFFIAFMSYPFCNYRFGCFVVVVVVVVFIVV